MEVLYTIATLYIIGHEEINHEVCQYNFKNYKKTSFYYPALKLLAQIKRVFFYSLVMETYRNRNAIFFPAIGPRFPYQFCSPHHVFLIENMNSVGLEI